MLQTLSFNLMAIEVDVVHGVVAVTIREAVGW